MTKSLGGDRAPAINCWFYPKFDLSRFEMNHQEGSHLTNVQFG